MNRDVMARRAAENGRTGKHASVTAPVVTPIRYVRKTRAAKMTKAQRDSTGAFSDWNKSATFWTDSKWSQTVGNQR